MMNLKLLSKLQSSDSVSLILKANAGDILDYYLIARSVSYDVVCSGQTEGSIPSGTISFDIRMTSVIPLIEKGYKLRIQYNGNTLKFVTEDERTSITPSYVESNDSSVMNVLEQYIAFSDALEAKSRNEHQIETITEELMSLRSEYHGISLMQLSGGPPADPFGGSPTEKIDAKYAPIIKDKEEQLTRIAQQATGLQELDLGVFTDLAGAASRGHNLVDMCGDYAVVSLKTSFMLQKAPCPIQSIQGQLFYQLLRDGNGKGFYLFNDELVYLNGVKEHTVVFVGKYLPNNAVDSTIVTRGAVEEKYTLQLKGVLNVAALVKSHFTHFVMDMSRAVFILSNDLGETIEMAFEVENAKTIALTKTMRGEVVQGGVTMAIIEVPSDVQSVLNLFKEELTIYVKKKKIIFQNKGLYLVFGR